MKSLGRRSGIIGLAAAVAGSATVAHGKSESAPVETIGLKRMIPAPSKTVVFYEPGERHILAFNNSQEGLYRAKNMNVTFDLNDQACKLSLTLNGYNYWSARSGGYVVDGRRLHIVQVVGYENGFERIRKVFDDFHPHRDNHDFPYNPAPETLTPKDLQEIHKVNQCVIFLPAMQFWAPD